MDSTLGLKFGSPGSGRLEIRCIRFIIAHIRRWPGILVRKVCVISNKNSSGLATLSIEQVSYHLLHIAIKRGRSLEEVQIGQNPSSA